MVHWSGLLPQPLVLLCRLRFLQVLLDQPRWVLRPPLLPVGCCLAQLHYHQLQAAATLLLLPLSCLLWRPQHQKWQQVGPLSCLLLLHQLRHCS
jgi:hypothetical protein